MDAVTAWLQAVLGVLPFSGKILALTETVAAQIGLGHSVPSRVRVL